MFTCGSNQRPDLNRSSDHAIGRTKPDLERINMTLDIFKLDFTQDRNIPLQHLRIDFNSDVISLFSICYLK